MQYLDNDMDELFRKAGENYPLKTELSDWDTIALSLKTSTISNKNHPAKKKKYPWFGLLALLFAVTGISLIVFNNKYSSSSEKVISAIQYEKIATETSINDKPENSPVSEADPKLSHFNSKRKVSANKKVITEAKSRRLNYSITTTKNPASFPENQQASKKIYPSSQIYPDIISYLNNKEAQNTKDHEFLIVPENKPGDFAKEVETKIEVTLNPLKSTDSVHGRIMSVSNKIEKKNNESRFYFGIVAGPQLNQVKGQGFTKTGFSAGLLAGYSVNRKLSVESGVIFSKKHYYSDGQYFDMKKAGTSMPANMEIISLTGTSNIFELPLKLKYDFGQRIRSNWYLTTGISSYLLTKENNEYIALVNGAQQNQNGNYIKKRSYFSGAFNVSLGYEVRTWQQTSIRIEPYLEIPMKGIGIGNLQVMTAGLRFGIIHRPPH